MIETIIHTNSRLAEGPHLIDNQLCWVDIIAGSLNLFCLKSRINQSRSFGDYVGFASPIQPGIWAVGCRNKLLKIDWKSGKTEVLLDLKNLIPDSMRINDGALDSEGRLWFGTLSLKGETNQASLFCYDGAKGIREIEKGITLSNGIDWHGGYMYFVDSGISTIFRYKFDKASGALSDKEVFKQFDDAEGTPDGICISSSGLLYVAMWGAGKVNCLDTQTSSVIVSIDFPAKNTSSCCLDEASEMLYVTSACEGIPHDEIVFPNQNGSIFSVELKNL